MDIALEQQRILRQAKRKRTRRLLVSEHDHMVTIFDWAKLATGQRPEVGLLHHVKNEGRPGRDSVGIKAGVPDLCLPVPRGKYHGFYCELKADYNSATAEQMAWMEALRKLGYAVYLCYGAGEVIEKIEEYLG